MSGARRRLLVAALAATTLAWIALRAGPAFDRWVEEREALVAARVDASARARARLSGAATLADSISSLEVTGNGLLRHVLAGSDPEVAGIEVTRRISDLIRAQPTQISSVERVAGDSMAVGRLRAIRVLARFTTDYEGLLDILRSVETDDYLWVDSVSVEAASDPPAEPGVVPLNITLRAGIWHASK